MSEEGHVHWRGLRHLGEWVCYDCGETVPTTVEPADLATLRASFIDGIGRLSTPPTEESRDE